MQTRLMDKNVHERPYSYKYAINGFSDSYVIIRPRNLQLPNVEAAAFPDLHSRSSHSNLQRTRESRKTVSTGCSHPPHKSPVS